MMLAVLAAAMLLVPATALAQDGADSETLSLQVWALLAGAIVPLGGYLLNYVGPWVSEPVKGVVQVLLAAVAGALVELIDQGSVGFDMETLEFVLSAVIASLSAHLGLWRPSTISTKMGGGRNAGDRGVEAR
jgi:hypothetical protein